MIYNIPSRTGSNVEAKTTLEISRIPNVVAVKEASGQLAQIADILRGRAPEFSVLSGDDEITVPVMSLGGDGIVSVISNAVPKLMSQLCEKMLAGDTAAAREIHFTLLPFMRAAFAESNPIPIKAALTMMGRIQNVLRLPLVPLADAHNAALRSALVAAGAIQ